MAIGTDAVIEFFGTQDTLGGSGGAITNGSFSVAGDLTDWTNDDDAPFASVTLECAFATAPGANTVVSLFAQKLDVQSTNDNSFPSANNQHTALGTFILNNVTTTQYITIDIALPNYKTSSVYDFAIRNRGGQTMSANWNLYITPKTIGPHP